MIILKNNGRDYMLLGIRLSEDSVTHRRKAAEKSDI